MGGETALFTTTTAQSLVVLALGAFAVPLLCRPVHLPAAVGEILFGLVVGPHVLGLVSQTEFIRLLGQVGFFLLMFIAGLELDFLHVEQTGRRRLGLRGVLVAGIFCCSFGFAWLLDLPPYAGLVLSAVSIGVPLVVLQEAGLARSRFGQELLVVGSMGEFAGILVATGVASWWRCDGLNLRLLSEVSQLALVFFLAWLLLVVLRTAVWWKSEAFTRVVETHDPSEIGVRAGLALMFAMVAVTSAFGIDPILGAFMAGALFSFVFRHKGPLEVKFLSLGNGFFVPCFFITVGLGFDLGMALRGDLVLFFKMLLLLPILRLLPLALGGEGGFRERLGGALMLSAPLTLLVVFANLGLNLKLIEPAFGATVILLAVVASTLYPFLFKVLARKISSDPPATGSASPSYLQP